MAKRIRKYIIQSEHENSGNLFLHVSEYPKGIEKIEGLYIDNYIVQDGVLWIKISPLYDFNEVKSEALRYIEETL